MSAQSDKERTARLFYNRNNQSVRFPKGFEIDADEVVIRKQGNGLLIKPKPRLWDDYFEKSHCLSDDFPDQIDDEYPQGRESF